MVQTILILVASAVGVLVDVILVHVPVGVTYHHIRRGLVRAIGIRIGDPVAFLQVVNVIHGEVAGAFGLSISGRFAFGRYILPVSCLSHSSKKVK
jgi:hypothetical protein